MSKEFERTNEEVDLDSVQLCAECEQSCHKLSTCILEILQIFKTKRPTLEERMIGHYLSQLLATQTKVAQLLTAKVVALPKLSHQSLLLKILDFNQEVQASLSRFLKAARYDLNYLEQYFEHDFYNEISLSQIAEDAQRLANKLESNN